MTTAVKIFAHRGIVSAHNARPAETAPESISLLLQPYLAREALTATASAVSSASATTPANTRILRVEIEDSKTIRYELNPPQRNVPADANSPRLSGDNILDVGEGWTISVIEA